MMQFDQVQKFAREAADAGMTSFGALSSGAQAAVSQVVDYTKESMELGGKATEQLLGARSFETVVQVQGDYLKTSVEGMVAQMSKLGELAANTAKEAYAPVEGLASRSVRAAA